MGIDISRVRVHDLKTWPQFYRAVSDGSKTFEARENDRQFQVGDVLNLREWDPDTREYTGASVKRRVSYMLQGGAFGVERGHCIMGLDLIESADDNGKPAEPPWPKPLEIQETAKTQQHFREQMQHTAGPPVSVEPPDAVSITKADVAANMHRLRAEGSAGGSAENYVTFGAEPPAEDVREAAALALFRYKWPDCSQWPGAKPGPDEYTAVDIVLAAYEKARPRLSQGARDVIEGALEYQRGLLDGMFPGRTDQVRAELERLG